MWDVMLNFVTFWYYFIIFFNFYLFIIYFFIFCFLFYLFLFLFYFILFIIYFLFLLYMLMQIFCNEAYEDSDANSLSSIYDILAKPLKTIPTTKELKFVSD